MFIGEAPGASEDRTGLPFQGRAGKRLDELLHEAGVVRNCVWITNVIKCRQSGDTSDEAVRACSCWLDAELDLLKPACVVPLGIFAARIVFKRAGLVPPERLSRAAGEAVHGDPGTGCNTLIFPVYHPASTFYSPDKLPLMRKWFRILGQLTACS